MSPFSGRSRPCTTKAVGEVLKSSSSRHEAEPKGIAKRSCRFALLSLVVSFLTLAASELARARGGGLDSLGCHNDRKQGEYHCHRGELAGQSFPSKAEAEETLRGGPPISSRKSPSSDAYNRKLYGGWIDQDGDCQNTRHEVLIAESTVPVTLDAKGCRVVSGRWHDPYTGRVFTDPRRLDIDHFIPLAEVHRSGGHAWTPAQRRQYANDLFHPDTLIAVSASANRSKGDRDPRPLAPAEPGVSLRVPEGLGRPEASLGSRSGPDGESVRGRKPLSETPRDECIRVNRFRPLQSSGASGCPMMRRRRPR